MSATLLERLLSFVDSSDPDACWEWRGNRHQQGYGFIKVNPRNLLAHRVSYELHVGPIPGGMVVCHQCDNPPCINPAHLRVGTQADNMRESVERGRHANAGKTHCLRGHPRTPENLSGTGSHRKCKICARASDRKSKARRKARLASQLN
jgi:hypothetical protein